MFQKKPEERASLWYNSCISSKTPSRCAEPLQTQLGLAQALPSLSRMKTWSKQQQELCENSGSFVTTPTTLLCGLGTRGGDSQGLGESKGNSSLQGNALSAPFASQSLGSKQSAVHVQGQASLTSFGFSLLSFQGASKPEPRTQRPMQCSFLRYIFLYIVYILNQPCQVHSLAQVHITKSHFPPSHDV